MALFLVVNLIDNGWNVVEWDAGWRG